MLCLTLTAITVCSLRKFGCRSKKQRVGCTDIECVIESAHKGLCALKEEQGVCREAGRISAKVQISQTRALSAGVEWQSWEGLCHVNLVSAHPVWKLLLSRDPAG